MLELLRDHHRLLTVRGAIALLFAVLAFAWPDTDWVVQFGVLVAYLVAEGVFGLLLALRGKQSPALDRSLFALPALFLLAGVAITALAFAVDPFIGLLGLVVTTSGWPVVNGIGQALAAARAKELYPRIGLAISGTLSIVAGVLVMNVPTQEVSLWTLLAWYAMVSGAIFLALGIRFQRGQGGPRAARPGESG
ncbi:DUF308 domain-containing protein [Crossiella sp. CA-258035]|uniref:HdeD family acid-resistance protein n=1 Tax=Crossiella sp. CA-258035 TaxID=2981138 RepID=UPI0024BC0BAA|nr:DUF308 domain-containing protein [Crossiella sp. CA-258035]WHT21658.1 DUF308 domain-containing protein [Crossiella sp. CA-258035]